MFFTKSGILTCLFFLACCLLLDIVWLFSPVEFAAWVLWLATVPFWLFSSWLAFRVFFGLWFRPHG